MREVEAPTFSDIRLTDRARLSALQAGRFLPPGRFLVFISVRGWVDLMAIVRLEGLGQLNKSTSSGTRTSDLPACMIVPEPTALPHAPYHYPMNTEMSTGTEVSFNSDINSLSDQPSHRHHVNLLQGHIPFHKVCFSWSSITLPCMQKPERGREINYTDHAEDMTVRLCS
jgi:hypothetical protein